MNYSIIVPVYNEQDNVAALHAEIVSVMRTLPGDFEIIMIDDGSSDDTVARLQELSPIVIIQLRKNFGQTAAMDAGIKQAQGELIITLDGDGQNPPSEIPKLLNAMTAGHYDVMSGWRKHRQDPLMKKLVSRVAYLLRSIFVQDHIHDSGCSLKVYKRECFADVDLFGEMHRFIPAVLAWSGFKIGEVAVQHRPRTAGVSKYNWRRTVKGLIDMLAIFFWRKYASRPLHLFGGLSFVLVLISSVLVVYLFIAKIFWHVALVNSNLPLLAVLLIVLAVQFFISGLLADIAMRNYYQGKRMPYTVSAVTKR